MIKDEPIYKDFLALRRSKTTFDTYANVLKNVRAAIGKEVYDATDDDLEKYILNCFKIKKLQGTTIGTYKAVLASFFKFQISHRQRKDDPSVLAREVATGNRSKVNPKALNEEQRQQVLDALIWTGGIREYQESLAILFSFKIGFRRFEIAQAKWDDIDFDAKEISVIGKGAKPATVDLPASLYEKLRVFRELMGKHNINSQWVFFKLSDKAGHYKPDWIYQCHVKLGKKIGIKLHTHQGRHTFCTILNEKQVPDLTAIQMSRHESVDMFKRYSKIEKEKRKAELNRAID